MYLRAMRREAYHEVLRVGMPLVVSMGATTVMQFTDRIFLGGYSIDAMAASVPAAAAHFLFIAFFMGVIGYVNVFVAQYTGSLALHRVGSAVWQGIYACIPATVVLLLLYLVAPAIFAFAQHEPVVQDLEIGYFRVLTLGSFFMLGQIALSCFFSGRGITRAVMFVNVAGTCLNIPLDYALINGVWIFPEWGIIGAGVATVASWMLMTVLYVWLIFTKMNETRFKVISGFRFDRDLFGRLMKYGLPGGVNFFLDVFGFTFFFFMIGRLGAESLAATNMAFSINTLVFLPMIGLHITVETLVGQAVGAGDPNRAEEYVTSALHLTMLYMGGVIVLLLSMSEMWILLFKPREMSAVEFAPILASGVVLLRFVAVYTLFDAMAIIYSGAVKGAGDTKFLMKLIGTVSMLVLVLPSYISVTFFNPTVYTMWVFITLYIFVLGTSVFLRYKQGKWKNMRVIETST